MSLAKLLGSSTRATIILALAREKKKISAYRISKMYNINVSKTYVEMKKLADMNLLRASKGQKGLEYSLEDKNLRELAIKLSSRTIPYDAWNDRKARALRLRNGLISIPKFSLVRKNRQLYAKPPRMRGELDNLAVLARSKFDQKYRMIGAREYAKV